MMAWTDRHCRFLHRLVAPSARLYTEMVSTDALLFGDASRLLAFSAEEHPLALQLGGGDAGDLARAARLGAAASFDELNLNVGCPSERVQKGAIGACLMREPRRVADAVAAMGDAAGLPVTVKCRIGVDDKPVATLPDDEGDYGPLRDFVGAVADGGVRVFIVHARKAVLSGLTPAQNRSVPPLRPALVARLKADFPHLGIVYNGGLRDTAAVYRHLEWADGVMVGRGAYRDPLWLSQLDAALFGGAALAPLDALRRYLPYVEARLAEGVPLHAMTRHLLAIFNGQPGARRYRRHLSSHGPRAAVGIEVLLEAAALVGDGSLGDMPAAA